MPTTTKRGPQPEKRKRTQKEKTGRLFCKYCGARLKRDIVGPYCSTRNCQWTNGVPR